jgi:hypothetical protein
MRRCVPFLEQPVAEGVDAAKVGVDTDGTQAACTQLFDALKDVGF